ncbi:hypothetical protein DICPUDRAFT_159838 [Dictyostelium purpureum]|uniref:Uncharacterized protein n=1 Tax=Dictyostelium purpureum TaxID=5786 RepID=F1A536_DICPU|nr:uncharacterized protein DICPUDRAFT_159838 [Dictyostelium purpureum]EGC28695.1 hypothetical protein DICPUDRAFT_159838 [Dictyostelium purpureum]|eukprot:XP_003294780.1 hypothetical protein DICPUDRAFT_159838 [Dictyostelium purpureum]
MPSSRVAAAAANGVNFFTQNKYSAPIDDDEDEEEVGHHQALPTNDVQSSLNSVLSEDQLRANREELFRLNLKVIQKLVRVYKGDFNVGIEIPSSKKGEYCDILCKNHSEALLRYHFYNIHEEIKNQDEIDRNAPVTIYQNPSDANEGTMVLVFCKDFNLELKSLSLYFVDETTNRIVFVFKHGIESSDRNIVRVLDHQGNILSSVVKISIPYVKTLLNKPANSSPVEIRFLTFTSHHDLGKEGDLWYQPEEYSLDQGRVKKVIKFIQPGFKLKLISK